MVRKHDIRTVCKLLTTLVPVDLGAGAVPPGMKRWVTFLKTQTEVAATSRIVVGSGVTATDITMANVRFDQWFNVALEGHEIPDSPNPDYPLFSIAENRYLTACASATSISLFIQYYDE